MPVPPAPRKNLECCGEGEKGEESSMGVMYPDPRARPEPEPEVRCRVGPGGRTAIVGVCGWWGELGARWG